MAVQRVGAGSSYAAAFVDAQKPSDGRRQDLQLHLPPQHPRQAVLVAGALRHPDALHAADRPAVPQHQQPEEGRGDNPDTSVDVYFGPTPPSGKESNWVQTWPGKGWNVILRLYGPLQPFFDKTWRPSEMRRFGNHIVPR